MKFFKFLINFSFPLLSVCLILIIFGLSKGSAIVYGAYPYILLVCLLLVLINIIKMLAKGKWLTMIYNVIMAVMALMVFYIIFYPRDLFFSNRTIPDGIVYDLPVDLPSKTNLDSMQQLDIAPFKMQLANYGQPGMYKSFIWIKPGEKGKIYLKGFDAMHDFELERIA